MAKEKIEKKYFMIEDNSGELDETDVFNSIGSAQEIIEEALQDGDITMEQAEEIKIIELKCVGIYGIHTTTTVKAKLEMKR